MKNFKLYSALVGIGIITQGLIANVSMAQENVITADTVYVNSTRSTKDLMEVPLSVSVVTAEEIEKMNANSLSEILKKIPGVHLGAISDPNKDQVTIRGQSNERIVVVIDGHRLSELNLNTGLDLLIDPATIESIEVIKGPASVLYGSDAIGGVISITTKKGGDRPLQAEFRTSYATINDAIEASLSMYGKVNKWNYRALISGEDTGDYNAYDGDLFGSSRQVNSANAFLNYDMTDEITFGANFEHYHKENEYSPNLTFFPALKRLDLLEQDRTKVGAFATISNINDYLSHVRLDAFYSKHDRERYTSPTSSDNNSLETMGVTAQTDWVIGDHSFIIAGYDFVYDSLDNHNISGKTGRTRVGSQTTNAAFISVEHYLPYNFTLGYGARYTHFATELEKNYSGNVNDSTSENATVFNASLVWTGIENFSTRMVFTQGFRAANLYNKYFTSHANPNLENESSNNYEIGVRYSANGLNLDAAVFHNQVDNRIDTVDLPSGDTIFVNIGKEDVTGVELSASYDFKTGFTPYVSLTYLNVDRPEGEALSDQPEWASTFGVKYNKDFKDGYYRYNADVNIYAQSGIDDNSTSVFNGEPIPGFATLNLSTGLEWGKKHTSFVQLSLNNILDKRYFTSYGMHDQAGINGSITFGYRF